jgi:hypothetical protein
LKLNGFFALQKQEKKRKGQVYMNREDRYLSDDEMALEAQAKQEIEDYKDFLRAFRREYNWQEILEEADLPGTGKPNERFVRFGELVEEATEIFKNNDDGIFLDNIRIKYMGNTGRLIIGTLDFSFEMNDFKKVYEFMSNFDAVSFDEYQGAVEITLLMRDILDEE